jgi:uncharacterized protein (DUF2141 family)
MARMLVWLAVLAFRAASAAELEVEVRGVSPHRGEVRVALFDNARDFYVDLEVRGMISGSGEISAGVFTQEEDFRHPPTRTAVANPIGNAITLHFTDLRPGEYAVAVFQDLNGNGRLDVTLGGASLEPWGMSNDPKRQDRRPPNWDDAKLEVPEGGASIVIELRR